VLDPKTVSEIGLLETPFTVELTLADRRRVGAKFYLAEVKAEGRRGPAFVAELDIPHTNTRHLRVRNVRA
jgi:predicted aspartyl protease